ncbi:hypothetical protein QJS04_geneDACA018430 [Acorus gramineus]|uniref:Uncharacterized protein n=1 Tax=Acorus gramineus TaxID=55184 RepID=A0AAV9ABH3_ACOGR|nr:hypothetical protein QJS04_geneDACA018430 [Acorus gramineus]
MVANVTHEFLAFRSEVVLYYFMVTLERRSSKLNPYILRRNWISSLAYPLLGEMIAMYPQVALQLGGRGGSDSTTVEDQDYDHQFTEHHPYSIPTPSSIPPTANVGDEATSPPRQSPLPPLPVAPKRQRTAVGQKLGSSIDRMCDILEMRTNLAYGNNNTIPPFADAMALVDRIPEIIVDSPLYFFALDMLREPGNRELVVAGLHLTPKDSWISILEDEIFPPTEGLEGDPPPSRASSSDESQMSTVRDAICNEIAAARGNAREKTMLKWEARTLLSRVEGDSDQMQANEDPVLSLYCFF